MTDSYDFAFNSDNNNYSEVIDVIQKVVVLIATDI